MFIAIYKYLRQKRNSHGVAHSSTASGSLRWKNLYQNWKWGQELHSQNYRLQTYHSHHLSFLVLSLGRDLEAEERKGRFTCWEIEVNWEIETFTIWKGEGSLEERWGTAETEVKQKRPLPK